MRYVVILALLVLAGCKRYDSAEECVLARVDRNTDPDTALLITNSCFALYPEAPQPPH